MTTCEWRLKDEDWNGWESSCGRTYYFKDGSPAENGFKFCPFCGMELDCLGSKEH